MTLKLPEPVDELLERSPLKLVVCQVRHRRKLAVSDIGAGLGVQDALGGPDNWNLEEFFQQTFAVGPSGDEMPVRPVGVGPDRGWRLTSEKGDYLATLLPTSFSLETANYTTWEAFSGQFEVLVRAVGKSIRPEAEERLGLRFVNQIENPTVQTPSGWMEWIRPEVVGILSDERIGPSILATQQVIDIDAGRRMRAAIRHGLAKDSDTGRLTYILDLDTFRQGVRVFDANGIVGELSKLHRLTLQLFQWMITEKMYRYLRGQDV